MVHVGRVEKLGHRCRDISLGSCCGGAEWVGEDQVGSCWSEIIEVGGITFVVGLRNTVVSSGSCVSGGSRSQPSELGGCSIVRVDNSYSCTL